MNWKQLILTQSSFVFMKSSHKMAFLHEKLMFQIEFSENWKTENLI